MNAFKVALLAVVAVLLVVQIVDRAREPAQLQAVKQSVDQLTVAIQQQVQETRALQRTLEAKSFSAASTPGTPTTTAANDAARDGKAKLGVNFLLPYDTTKFHADWVGGTIRYFEIPPSSINNILENEAGCGYANDLFNDSLCEAPPEHPLLYTEGLATSAVITDDYTTYTFTIRKGVKWQRPAIAKQKGYEWMDKDVELTAADFVAWVDMVRDPNVQDPALKGYYEDLDKAEALDDYTLRLHWKKKLYTNLDGSLSLKALPRHVYWHYADGSAIPREQVGVVFNKHWFDEAKQAIGVGPYLVEQFEPTKTLTFTLNPGFWGAPFHFRRIEWDGVTKDPNAKLVAFKNGQVQEMDSLLTPSQYKAEILDGGEPRFDQKNGRAGVFGWERVHGLEGKSLYSFIGWNMRRPLFHDVRTRQALACAMPKERILKEVYFGLGTPQIGPVNPDSDYFDKSLVDFPFDPAKAKALLADAGWADHDGDGWLDQVIDGKKVDLRFHITYYGANPVWPKVLSIYKDVLAQIGVELTPDPCEDNELERRMDDKDFDGVCSGWLSPLDIDFDQLWNSKYVNEAKSSNYPGFADPRVDELAAKLRVTFEPDQRMAIGKEVQRILFEAQPYLFFRNAQNIFVWQNRPASADDKREILQGVVEGLDQYHPLYNRYKALWHLEKK
jgi:peptide/nickel transport system substrate-binding protein